MIFELCAGLVIAAFLMNSMEVIFFGLGGDWILHEYTADQILSLRARCKWNIIPYGTKLGYCDDMRRALELNRSPSDDQFARYNKDCN